MNVLLQAKCDQMDDSEIVSGILQGSPAAADALLERFGQPLVRYFSVHLPDRSQAEDMAQEVFVRLITALRRDGRQVRSLYSLIFTIARNLAHDVRKSAKRCPVPIQLEKDIVSEVYPGPQLVRLADESPDPRTVAQLRQEQQLLENALLELPTETRELLILRHIDGLSARDIAEIAGIAEGTVWSRLNRGLHELRSAYHRLSDTPGTTTSVRPQRITNR